MDSCLYENTSQERMEREYMSKKEVLYVNDQNGGAYNGQIQIDTSVLSSMDLWNAYSEAYLEIPFNITYTSSADVSGAGVINGFMLGMKNGYFHILDSISVHYNGQSVVQQQPFSNFHVAYKLMTTWSQDDLAKHGHVCGFYPDSAGSASWSAGASRSGDGVSNNVIALPSTTGTHVWALGSNADGILHPQNDGLRQRLELTAFPATSNDSGYGAIPTVNSSALCAQLGKNHVVDNAGAGSARVWKWNILATIRLKDICDFFDKVPMTKGGYLNMIINYNSCTASITSAGAPSPTLVHVSNPTMTSGRTCPIIMASANENNPCDTILNGTNSIACGIGSNVQNHFGSDLLNQVRLYVPSYKLKPRYEEELIAERTRRFKYCDILSYQVLNVSSGSSINQVLTNGVKNPKALVVVPQMNNTAGNNATIALFPQQSLFDSAPATTAPLSAIDNFNVQVSGIQVFQQNQLYDFEQFKNEIESINAIDGGCTVGMSNGLLGYKEWDNNYRYYVADLSREGTYQMGLNQSVVLQGLNQTGKAMDYYCFVEYEKEAEVDLISGKLRVVA